MANHEELQNGDCDSLTVIGHDGYRLAQQLLQELCHVLDVADLLLCLFFTKGGLLQFCDDCESQSNSLGHPKHSASSPIMAGGKKLSIDVTQIVLFHAKVRDDELGEENFRSLFTGIIKLKQVPPYVLCGQWHYFFKLQQHEQLASCSDFGAELGRLRQLNQIIG